MIVNLKDKDESEDLDFSDSSLSRLKQRLAWEV